MSTDNYKIQKIAKKYSYQNTRRWTLPSEDVLNAVESILLTNKAKVLSSVPGKRVNTVNLELSKFINGFIKDLAETKLPKTINATDFDYEHQLKRQKILQNLYSNELKIVERLDDALAEEENGLEEITRFVDSYKKMTREAKKKWEEIAGDEDLASVIKNISEEASFPKGVSLDGIDNDDDLMDLMRDLDQQLERIDNHTEGLQELSKRLDDLHENLS